MRNRFLFCFFFMLLSYSSFSQEQFFGNQNGFSFSGLRAFSEHTPGIWGGGIDLYFKKGFSFSAGFQKIKNAYPFLGLTYFIKTEIDHGYPMAAVGFSTSSLNDQILIGFNAGYILMLLTHTSFPLSLTGIVSIQDDISGGTFRPSGIFSIGYTQSFFVDSRIFPVLGFARAFSGNADESMNMFFGGFNIRL